MARARVTPSGDQDGVQASQRSTSPPSPYLALVKLVQADGAAIDLAGPAPERFAGMVPPGFQCRQPPPNVLLQVQLRRQSRGSDPGRRSPRRGAERRRSHLGILLRRVLPRLPLGLHDHPGAEEQGDQQDGVPQLLEVLLQEQRRWAVSNQGRGQTGDPRSAPSPAITAAPTPGTPAT